MENKGDREIGAAEMGNLIMKFQNSKGYSASEVMSIVRPWKQEAKITTVRMLVLLIHVGGLDKFRMDTRGRGCRRWTYVSVTKYISSQH